MALLPAKVVCHCWASCILDRRDAEALRTTGVLRGVPRLPSRVFAPPAYKVTLELWREATMNLAGPLSPSCWVSKSLTTHILDSLAEAESADHLGESNWPDCQEACVAGALVTACLGSTLPLPVPVD